MDLKFFSYDQLFRHWRSLCLSGNIRGADLGCPECSRKLHPDPLIPILSANHRLKFRFLCDYCGRRFEDSLPLHRGSLWFRQLQPERNLASLRADLGSLSAEPFKGNQVARVKGAPNYANPRDWFVWARAFYHAAPLPCSESVNIACRCIDSLASRPAFFEVDGRLLETCQQESTLQCCEPWVHRAGLLLLKNGTMSMPDATPVSFIAYAAQSAGVSRFLFRAGTYAAPCDHLLVWAGDLASGRAIFLRWNLGPILARCYFHGDCEASENPIRFLRYLIRTVLITNRLMCRLKPNLVSISARFGDVPAPLRLDLLGASPVPPHEPLSRCPMPWGDYLDVMDSLQDHVLYSPRNIAEKAWSEGLADHLSDYHAWTLRSLRSLRRLVKRLDLDRNGDGHVIENKRMVKAWYGINWKKARVDGPN